MTGYKIDEIGPWSEIKLEILREYVAAYSKIMSCQTHIKHFAYIDGFAGAGTHMSLSTGEEVEGSPMIALNTEPPFSHYHFIDLDGERTSRLDKMTQSRSDVTVYEGDCNDVLLDKVFPSCRYDNYRRALCLLDPYALNPKWEVVETAGKMKSIEIFLNFMIMDANMNVLRKNPYNVSPQQAQRMTNFWGDETWKEISYQKQTGLFGPRYEKRFNDEVAFAYRNRLKEIAKFEYVPDPIPMRNSQGAIIYYLFFASPNKTGNKIIKDIFKKWRKR